MPQPKPAASARWRWTLLALTACALPAAAQHVAAAGNGGLAELSLEQLSELPVTSVSGRPESLRSAPASVFVISAEDIRRSAATTLPEALRLAPNLEVARLNSGQYAISARGFNNALANKLLVLVDGRTIYSTLFAGVFWDSNDVMLEDIERIEVISGPGGTLWGANAVNGIINVITKAAGATQGTLAAATRSRHGGQEAVRWGGKLGEVGHLRLYALALDRDNSTRADGVARPDAAAKHQAGFRSDLTLAPGQLTVQGDVFRGGDDPANGLAPKLHGGNLLARWDGRFAGGSPYRLQAYYDLQARDETVAFRNQAESVDLQFTHEPQLPAVTATTPARYWPSFRPNAGSPGPTCSPSTSSNTAPGSSRWGPRWSTTATPATSSCPACAWPMRTAWTPPRGRRCRARCGPPRGSTATSISLPSHRT